MGLANFKRSIKVRPKEYNAAFCIMLTQNVQENVNHINQVLEKVQIALRARANGGVRIQKAFIYRNINLNVIPFEEASIDKIYYMDYAERGNPMTHTLLRSLLSLKDKAKNSDKCVNILYLIVDQKIDRVEDNRMVAIMKAFEDFPYLPVLIKKDAVCSSVEKYISKEKNGQVFLMEDLINENAVPYY